MKTTDYSRFKFRKTNRDIKRSNVEAIKQSLQKIGFIDARPMIVNERDEIIDGQHRLVACQELGIPVTYQTMRANGKTDILISELNKNQRVWSVGDHINHYAELGIKAYCIVRDFEEKYKLGICNSYAICTTSKGTVLRAGKNFKVNDKRDDVADFIIGCSELSYYKSSKFIYAVKTLFDKTTPENVAKVFKKRLTIPQQPSTKFYLTVFENIINKRVPASEKIKL